MVDIVDNKNAVPAYNELHKAINKTKKQIYQLRSRMEEPTNTQDRKHLEQQLKELQILQLWHLDQLNWKL